MRYFAAAIFLCLLFSCNQDKSQKDQASTDSVAVTSTYTDTMPVVNDEIYDEEAESQNYLIWKTDIDSKSVTKNPGFKNANFSVDSIIKGLNLKYREIPLEKIKLSHDTLYTQIKNSEYLGEQIGSTGAAYYLAEAVINLTTIKGVKFVNIAFAEGSHASPGVFTRKDFEDYQIIDK
jgi:hypothetical protein